MATKSVTIASGATASSAVNLTGYKHFAFDWPATMTGATVGFEAGPSKVGPWKTVNNEAGTALAVTATDGQINAMNAEVLEVAALGWVRLVSAGAEAAGRTILIYCER